MREDEDKLAGLAEELADILVYALSLANSLSIDISTAVNNKLAKDAKKYPVDEYKGRF